MRIVFCRPPSERRIALAVLVALFALGPAPLARAAGAVGTGGSIAANSAAPDTIKTPTIATAGTPNTASAGSTITPKPAGGALGLARTPASKTSVPRRASSGKLSTGAVLAAVIGGLLALACIGWALLRWSAVEPRWTLPLRHSIAEAGFRASSVWAEFTDWIRLGH